MVADGVFEVIGRGVEMLVERHDLSNPEAIGYLERRLNEIGVIKALRDAGFESGDEVRVGDEAFDLDILDNPDRMLASPSASVGSRQAPEAGPRLAS